MDDFSEVWRRRQACERCRKHKVRCEYGGPTEESCIRCVRNGAECVTRMPPKRKETRPGAPPSHASGYKSGDGELPRDNNIVYASSGSGGPPHTARSGSIGNSRYVKQYRDYFASDLKTSPSPLEQCIEEGLYTRTEAQDLYALFIKATPSFVPMAHIASTLEESDRKFPILTICMITVTALTSQVHKGRERLDVVEPFFATGFMGCTGQQTTLDSLLGYLVLCVYALPYGERGLSRLYLLHASSSSLCSKAGLTPGLLEPQAPAYSQKKKDDVQRVRQYATSCLVGFTFCSPFAGLKDVLDAALPLVNLLPMEDTGGGHAEFLSTVFQIYKMNFDALKLTSCFDDAVAQCNNALQQFYLAESILQSDPAVLSHIAKIKMFRVTFLWIVPVLNIADSRPLCEMMAQAISSGESFTTYFASVGVHEVKVLPAFFFYFVEEFLSSMWILRYLCFAAGIDVDVPIDSMIERISERWQHLIMRSYIARQAFVALLPVDDMATYKIGYLNEHNKVVGSGASSNWAIYKINDAGKVHSQITLSREKLASIIKGEIDTEDNMASSEPGLLTVLGRIFRSLTYSTQ